MTIRSVLLPGNSGWNPASRPPPFSMEREPALHFAFRRLPAVIRVTNPELLPGFEQTTEEEAFAAVRFWMDPERRRTIGFSKAGEGLEHATSLRSWTILKENRAFLSWWRSPQAWRAPREFPGYRKTLDAVKLPHVEPFEVANFRLPDDISCDADVVLFQAWCQGMMAAAFSEKNPLRLRHATSIRSGLRKFARSPWIRSALAAPLMQPVGVTFPGHSYFDSCLRLEFLLSSPFQATDSELEHILQSVSFKAADGRSRTLRADGTYLHPNGTWYVGGSISRALGSHFRRGGLQPAKGVR